MTICIKLQKGPGLPSREHMVENSQPVSENSWTSKRQSGGTEHCVVYYTENEIPLYVAEFPNMSNKLIRLKQLLRNDSSLGFKAAATIYVSSWVCADLVGLCVTNHSCVTALRLAFSVLFLPLLPRHPPPTPCLTLAHTSHCSVRLIITQRSS